MGNVLRCLVLCYRDEGKKPEEGEKRLANPLPGIESGSCRKRTGMSGPPTSHLLVVTVKAKSESGLFLLRTELVYVGQDCKSIPRILANKYGESTTRLDMSFNALLSLQGIEKFCNLEELVLDNNQLGDTIRLAYNPYLRALSLNKNKISDLEGLVEMLSERVPNLEYLSLHGNPACPSQLSNRDHNEADYQRYRYYVLFRLRKLKFLDSRMVTDEERYEASRVGPYTKVIRPSPSQLPDDADGVGQDESRYSPLPPSTRDGQHAGAYGTRRTNYLGKHSEGNRFIYNKDL
ncbi:unnamed protein product [Darwinula stevensoni]|uniref:Leucine-rich melanocyte differentiation-associated protein n=1 Tax=Darwinula stevensoni TaxID=69355 RepID=A0A7R8XD29_9CRUS|nr:unnamed protein product [Darwinula stevensoni]CAG0893906.1 unnamed protein product [Darwinula stevensoni]